MTRILITGMSGTGKSALFEELSRRGVATTDTDYGGHVLPNGLWDAVKMNMLLATHAEMVVSGTVENQGDFYNGFDHIEPLLRRGATGELDGQRPLPELADAIQRLKAPEAGVTVSDRP